MSAVWVIRAIVWCSPHSGHWETSSKRLRQLTQRRRPGSWVGRSQGSPQFGHGARSEDVAACRCSRPRTSSDCGWVSRPALGQSADEEPGGAVAVGAQLQGARLVRRGELGREGAEVVQLERRRPGRRRSLRAAPRSGPRSRAARSCRSSRRACRPAAAASPRASSAFSCTAATRSIVRGDLRQRASGREASVPRSEQGASRRIAVEALGQRQRRSRRPRRR